MSWLPRLTELDRRVLSRLVARTPVAPPRSVGARREQSGAIWPSRGRQAKVVGAGVALLLGSAFLLWFGPLFDRIVGGVGVVFFGAAFVVLMRRTLRAGPLLVLHADGFEDRSSAMPAGFVPWASISGIDIIRVRRQQFLVVRLREPAGHLDKGSAVRRTLIALNAGIWGPGVYIPATLFPMSASALRSLLLDRGHLQA